MRISIGTDFDRMIRGFQNLDKQQVPYLMASTLTATAKDVQADEVAEINRSFDRPTPTTQRSIFVQPATKSRWTAIVGIKDRLANGNAPIKWEEVEIEGGQRRMKRYEKALQLVGAMPPGYYTVPGESVQLDQYGNVPQSLTLQDLAKLDAAIASGRQRVKYADKEVQYRTMDEMMQARTFIVGELQKAGLISSTSVTPSTSYASFSRD